jgi:hypothetical protein
MVYGILFSMFNVCFFPKLTCQIMKNNPSLGPTKAQELSRLISTSANKFGFKPSLYAAILMQESAYRLDVKGCGDHGCDHGIAQIYDKTAEAYGFDKARLRSDLAYSVDAGAEVLAWFYDTYRHREPRRWWVRYNCGTRKKINRTTCNEYERKVRRWM